MTTKKAVDLEKIAAVQHEIWTHWMRFLLTAGEERGDGSIVLPPDKVARWRRQMDSTYAQLPEAQKQSDRDQAVKVIAAIEGGET